MHQKNQIRNEGLILLTTIIIMGLLMGMIVACAPSHFTPAEKKIYTLTKTLQSTKQFRETGLKVSADFYKKGLMEEKTKLEIIDIADELQNAINLCADSLEIYLVSNGLEGSAILEHRILLYQALYGKFSELIMPYLLKEGRIE